jgi:hypothetical protein
MTNVGNELQNMQKRIDDGLTTCIFLQQFLSLKWVSGPAKQRLIAQGFAQPVVQQVYANMFAKNCNYISAMGYRLLFFPIFVRKSKQQYWKFRESVPALK